MWRRFIMPPVTGLLALAAILFNGCGGHQNQTLLVAPAVTLDGFLLGGKDLDCVGDLLERAAEQTLIPPLDGQVSADGHCIPGRWGLQLNSEQLKERIGLAPEDSQLLSTFELVSPTFPAECEMLPVREAAAGTRSVGLMINVAWGEDHLPKVLSVLQEANAHATFFIMGFWAEEHPEQTRAIAQMGHEIAVHGYHDLHPRDMSPGAFREDLEMSITTLTRLTGRRPTLYTPHYGEVDESIVTTARDLGLATILWTTDTVDWMNKSARQMLDRVLPDTRDGAFILMHPTENAAAFLSEYLPRLHDMGLTARSCSDTLNRVPAPAAGLDEVFEQMRLCPE